MRPSFLLRVVLLSALGMTASFPLEGAKPQWTPISAEDLAATACKTYPGASAEVLSSRQSFEATRNDSWTNLSKQIKIYSPKGAEEVGILNIEYPSRDKIWDTAARVTKHDGKTIDLGPADFHDSLFVKVGGYKRNRSTLAVPNLEAGDVIEIKWSQNVRIVDGSYYEWFCQEPVPVRSFNFVVNGSTSAYRILSFNLPQAELKRLSSSQVSLEVKNQPPFTEEPEMAPERDVRGWFLVLFTSTYMARFTGDDVWKDLSAYLEEDYRLETKPNSTIKAKAAELTNGAATEDEKLRRLYEFCQNNIRNYDYFESDELQAAKKRIEDGGKQEPVDTLKRGIGSIEQINALFAALARAVGFEVKLARAASRDIMLQVQNQNGWLFIPGDLAAVQGPKGFRYFSPGDFYVPFGAVPKENEAATCLICDPDKVILETIPATPAGQSLISRKGRFTLDADGNLEGDVEISFGGQPGVDRKIKWRNTEPADVDKEYRASVTERLASAEVGELKWEHVRGNTLPMTVKYKLKIPGYADLSGTKLILVPNVFAHGAPATFSAETRRFPIYFPYAWSEHDDIEIALPEGYTLDAASAPANLGDPAGTLGSRYNLGYRPKARILTYKRDFALGANGAVAFQAASYLQVKKVLDGINRSDEHAIVFKPAPAAPPPEPTPPAAAPGTPPAPATEPGK